MPYSEYTLESACQSFALGLDQDTDLFGSVPAVRVSPMLRSILDDYVPLATSIHTEKARSEFILAPILAEVRRLMDKRISLFSGLNFEVDKAQGLDGVCDFILAASPNQLFLSRPVVMIVEAKNDNIKSGLGQCIAEMVAARQFNLTQREGPRIVYGAVTTGSIWKFLRLKEKTVSIDRPEYYLDQVDKVLGILAHCVGYDPATAGAAA
jgi:hypothetical protein